MKELKNNKGITLVALVVTIIVLLILAAVSLSAVFSQDGIFRRAEQANDKHGQAKARETLELALGEAQMQKYEEGLTDEQLDNKIGAIEGELLPKEKPEYPNLQNVIVDGYIFEIDRSVPKIVDYVGPADGVIITSTVTGNNGWLKPSETNVTVTGKIVTYSGGTITNVSATKGGTAISGFSINGEGRYTINNITEDTTIVINAEDSNEKKNTRTIPITIKIDNMPPVVDTIDAKAEGLTIKFTATGHDNESGLKHFNYTISSTQDTILEGIPADKRTGTFTLGQTVEITTTPTGNRDETQYTISVTSVDNCDNTSIPQTAEVITVDGITIAQAKELVNADNLKDYIGTRIIDYNPEAGGVWRIFYYDSENYFGDGNEAIYLLRDYQKGHVVENFKTDIPTDTSLTTHTKKFNPIFFNNERFGTYTENWGTVVSEVACNPEVWTKYKSEGARYAIGGVPLEMLIKSLEKFIDTGDLSIEVDQRGRYIINGKDILEHGISGVETITIPLAYDKALHLISNENFVAFNATPCYYSNGYGAYFYATDCNVPAASRLTFCISAVYAGNMRCVACI